MVLSDKIEKKYIYYINGHKRMTLILLNVWYNKSTRNGPMIRFNVLYNVCGLSLQR